MALDVTVKINLAQPTGKAGTWFPCLYVLDGTVEADEYGTYTKLSELIAAGYKEDSEVYKAANLIFMQDNAPAKIAVLKQKAFATAEMAKYLKKGWRQLVLVGTHENTKDIAQYIETTDKMLFTTMYEKSALETLYTAVKEYNRILIVYYTDSTVNAAAAVVGATSGLKAGSLTYKNTVIKGVVPLELSDAEIEDIHDNGAITILEKAGDTVTSEGKVASGEYADIIDSQDYIVQNITQKTQKVFNNNAKVPYDNKGIAMLELATFEALVDGYNNGMIADNIDGTPAYSTNFVLRSGTTEEDRAARSYPYGKFTFALAGAIHNCEVVGEVTV